MFKKQKKSDRHIIEKLKDYIIMQMYFNNFDTITQCSDYSNCSFYYSNTNVDKGWNFDEFVDYIGTGKTSKVALYYSAEYAEYNITKEHIEKSLFELIGDRFLKKGNPDNDTLYFCDKGKQHHLTERSFEYDYINKNKVDKNIYLATVAIWIAIISIVISATIPYISKII